MISVSKNGEGLTNTASRITTETAVLRKIRLELLEEAVDALIESVRNIDMPLEELLDLVKRKYESEA
ncbi:hypothetical protein [Paenibacillus alkalitolerans]|uniref:hypothetical protein n=1 Tax=Paenibacillus alkalitolerans TaxID=2799335 RepID=UPI0018F4BF4D|nr:hypothetical protein [Paenibacillus alkalitolerans]